MNEKQVEKLAQELSEEELNELAAGKMSEETKKKVLKYGGIALGTAAGVVATGVGVAALVGWRTGKGSFGYLHPMGNPSNTSPQTGSSTQSRPETFQEELIRRTKRIREELEKGGT